MRFFRLRQKTMGVSPWIQKLSWTRRSPGRGGGGLLRRVDREEITPRLAGMKLGRIHFLLVLCVVAISFLLPRSVAAAVPTIAEIVMDFRTVFGRAPTVQEQEYWKSRRIDKLTRQALKGAMATAKAQGKSIADPPARTLKELAAAVPTAFARVFGRAPKPAERQYWADRALCGDLTSYKGLLSSLAFHKSKGVTVGGGTKETFCARVQQKKQSGIASMDLGIGGHAAGPLVRIGIAELPEVRVTSNGNFFLRFPDNKKKNFSAGQVARVTYKSGTYTVRGPGDFKRDMESPARFSPIGGAILAVANYTDRGASGRNYNRFRGSIEARANSAKSALWAINELRVEDYVKGIGETTDNAPEQFHKSLAVAARTYVLHHHRLGGRQPHNGFDIGNTPNDQIYRGYAYEAEAAPGYAKNAAATRGQVVTYDGKLIATVYFSSSDGRTRSGQEVWRSSKFPYLQAKKDPYGGGVLRGHGTGMSATGAIGFVRREGWDYKKVLSYYFTGIRLAKGY